MSETSRLEFCEKKKAVFERCIQLTETNIYFTAHISGVMRIHARLQKELRELIANPDMSVSSETLTEWKVTFAVAEPYDRPMTLRFRFNANYPLQPPSVNFTHPVFHPNVSTSGELCVDILGGMWSPVLTVEKLVLSIQTLLLNPNPLSPLNGTAARLWDDKPKFLEQMLKVMGTSATPRQS